MQAIILGSGSKGNCTLVRSGNHQLLIDNGFSGKETVRRLRALGVDPQELHGIVVSHEHNDHIRGVGVLARKLRIPVYISESTYAPVQKHLGSIDARFFRSGAAIRHGDLVIETIPLPHDAADPVGFIFSSNGNGSVGSKLAHITDLGRVTPDITRRLREISALIIEANHDVEMLLDGPYPWTTKQRIRSRNGHLSNEASAELIADVVSHTEIQQVTLAHMSENNNDPNLARDTILRHVEATTGKNLTVNIASQHSPAKLIDVH